MKSGILLNSASILLLMLIAVSLVYAINGFIAWYRMTSHFAARTHITVYRLQEIIAKRAGTTRLRHF